MATVRIQLRRGTSSQWDNANPTLAAGEIGIETDTNTFKFGDGVTAWNSLDYALSDTVDDYIPLSLKGAANGVAELDGQGYVPAAQLPPLAKVTVNAVADQSARLALTVEPGDIAIQSDNGTTYVLQSSPASTNANWKEISATAAISAAVSAHEADTSNVHGIVDTSLLVTTTGTQTLTNKTLTSPVINTPTGIVKADVGLSNVDNTSDLNKPVSTAQAAADTAVANDAANALSNHESNGVNVHGISDTASLVTVDGTQTLTNKTLTSPELTGTPIAPTAASNTNNTQIATTAFAKSVADIAQSNAEQYATSQITAVIGTAPAALNTLQELAAAINDDANYAGTVTNSITNINTSINNINNDLALKAPLASPTFTGTVGLPSSTNIGDVSNVELAYLNGVTSSIQGQIDAKLDSTIASSTYAPLASPTFTGNVTLPSSTSIGDVSNLELAYLNGVTSDVQSQIDAKLDSTIASSTYAPLASPTFTGNVTLPSSTSIGDVSNLELGYLDGVTSGIQTQLDAKAPLASPTFTGTVVLPNDTVTGAMIADVTIPTGKIADTAITAAKLASSAVETDKINDAAVTTAKINDGAVTSAKIADGTIVDADINASAAIDWTKLAISSTVSATELGYVDGVTSAIQTQIDSKAAASTVSSHNSATTSVHGISDTAQLAYLNAANQTFTGNMEVDGNMTVDGNLTINGTTFNASATSITIEDNMVQLAHQNSSNSVDLGLVVAYTDGTAKHAGIVRDVSDSKWKLFKDVADEPATTVNFGQGSLDNLAVNNVEVSGVVFSDGTQTKEGVPSRTTVDSKTADYTLVLTDRDKMIEVNSSSALTVSIPTDASVNFPIGTSIDLLRVGSGAVTISAATPATTTLNYTPGNKLRAQWSSATLFKRAANTWVLMGDLTA